MTLPRAIAAILLTVAALAMVSLAFGGTYLEAMLPGGLPLGNAVTAIGLCAAAGAAVALSARDTALRAVSLASLIAAAAWLPVSITLAGNLALNFGGGRGFVWVVLSLGICAGVFGALAWALVGGMIERINGFSLALNLRRHWRRSPTP